MKNIIVYNQRVAGELMSKGHNLIEIKKNKTNTDFNVFYFRDSEMLKRDMEEILSWKK